jgi:SAM-dependent methyltransferase
MNFRQLAYGILSFIPFVPESLYRGTGGTGSARYCYSIWLRHLVLANSKGMSVLPMTLAELGPGDSIGVGLAALISGVEHYIALDAMEHTLHRQNLEIFDELVELFHARATIPGSEEFPDVVLDLPSLGFPRHVLTEEILERALDPQRIDSLRRQATGRDHAGEALRYRAPWTASDQPGRGTVDMILSNAVMEHVEDIGTAYRAMFDWLRPGAVASHQIDFRSHGLFGTWDGHWACPDWLWRLFMGRRTYLINRLPLSAQLNAIRQSGFEILSMTRHVQQPERERLAARFAGMSREDRETAAAYLLLRRPARD